MTQRAGNPLMTASLDVVYDYICSNITFSVPRVMTPANVPPVSAATPAALDLGIVGNCAISALINSRADMVWCCMPRFDGDPVFYSLLDSPDGIGDEGSFRVELEGAQRFERQHVVAVIHTHSSSPISSFVNGRKRVSGAVHES